MSGDLKQTIIRNQKNQVLKVDPKLSELLKHGLTNVGITKLWMDIVANKLLMFGEEEQAAVLLMQLSLMDLDVEDDQNLELKKSNDIPKMDLVIYNPIDISKMDYGELRR